MKALALAIILECQWRDYRQEYPILDNFTSRRLWLGYAFR